MPKLIIKTEIAVYIVQQLAFGETPQTVADLVKANFDLELSRQCVSRYNPATNPRLNEKWVELFERSRARMQAALALIPVSHKSYRLRQLQRLYRTLEAAPVQNTVEMRAILNQAAKETNGFYERR